MYLVDTLIEIHACSIFHFPTLLSIAKLNESLQLLRIQLQALVSTIRAVIDNCNMTPRLACYSSLPFGWRSALQIRVAVSRFSTASEDAVIKPQQIPAPGSGHIRVLQLNRPEARNALSRQLVDSLSEHIRSISSEQGNGPTRALVLASNVDSAFCAGADLKERANMTSQECVGNIFPPPLSSIVSLFVKD